VQYLTSVAIRSRNSASELINAIGGVNRGVALVEARMPVGTMQLRASWRSGGGGWSGLRKADKIMRRLSHETGYDHEVWQFPVILIPLGSADHHRGGGGTPIPICVKRCAVAARSKTANIERAFLSTKLTKRLQQLHRRFVLEAITFEIAPIEALKVRG
jgi:hypothetical protein